MKLNYDIDILPPSRRCVSVGQDAPAQVYHAAFRDPQTAQAARNASTRTLAILNEAGIATEPYSTGAPLGHYPCSDGRDQEYVMACLVGAIISDEKEDGDDATGDAALTEVGEAFYLSACLVQLSSARPFGALVPVSDGSNTPEKASMPVCVAIGVLAAAGYIAGFSVLS